MKPEYIAQRLKSEEYSFLREHESLGKNIILLTTGGSHAYGTEVETSDLDIRGICVNSKREILTMDCLDTPIEDRKTDTVIYFLKQIINLLLNCNPNCIEMLGTKEEHLFVLSEEGKMLRDHADYFLSQKAVHSFGGYATAQLRRLQNALARGHYPQKEKEKHILGSLHSQMVHLQENYHTFTNGELKLYIDKSNRKDFDEEIYMDIELKHYPIRDFKSIYSDMSNVIRDYESLNHRNNKKDELHLNKHAMHLIRLLIMGTEILEGEGVNTYRGKDRDFLMKIRNGEFVTKKGGKDDYTHIFEIVDEYEKKFKYAAEHTVLPSKPRYKEVEDLAIAINRRVLGM
ncbi:MAG: nucleotidyltransferase domain-containing protein [Clostridia bacterium]|nr:nucleotidyltransferase domain-containing protein [Clostridia bacterium]